MRETRGNGNCIGIGIALSFALSLSWHFVGRGVHTVGHASPPLDAASWRRSSAFSSARRLSSATLFDVGHFLGREEFLDDARHGLAVGDRELGLPSTVLVLLASN